MCIRKLKANEIECRVATVKKTGISLLLYKTARVDRAILEEYYGDLWQNDFKVIDGKMYGGIGIYNKELKEWLWRWDCGTESNTEAEKGQASDCFKRAGFKFGIGIELYTAPFIWVSGNGDELKTEKYDVATIGYSDLGEINKLTIVNAKTKDVVFELGKFIKKEPKNTLTEDDKMLIVGVDECQTNEQLKNYWLESRKAMSSDYARKELDKAKDKRKEVING